MPIGPSQRTEKLLEFKNKYFVDWSHLASYVDDGLSRQPTTIDSIVVDMRPIIQWRSFTMISLLIIPALFACLEMLEILRVLVLNEYFHSLFFVTDAADSRNWRVGERRRTRDNVAYKLQSDICGRKSINFSR
jgi:hypothetical protein